MPDVTATRTLVKSAPELWTECSDAASLSRHLDHFGEIRITRLEPETAVGWEGEHASGTVRLEPSGWGTRVVLTATPNPPRDTPPPAIEPAARAGGPAEPDPAGSEPVVAEVGVVEVGVAEVGVAEVGVAEVGVAEPDSPVALVPDSPVAPDNGAEAAEPPTPAQGFFARLRGLFGRGRA